MGGRNEEGEGGMRKGWKEGRERKHGRKEGNEGKGKEERGG